MNNRKKYLLTVCNAKNSTQTTFSCYNLDNAFLNPFMESMKQEHFVFLLL